MKFNLNLENINYIKLSYTDNNNEQRDIKAAIKSINEREIIACAKFDDGLYIKTPQNISLNIICENGLYKTNTSLKFVENDPPYIFFNLVTPKDLDYQQNREYFRVKMNEDIIISYKKNNEVKRLICKSYDISASGVKIETTESLDNVEEVLLNILFSPKDIKVKAKLIRIEKDSSTAHVSFKFQNISETDMDIISQKCIQKQLEYKRNNVR